MLSGIQAVIATLNRMEEDGVLRRYAIGGAVGATFYLEPVATLDVDVFAPLDVGPGGIIVGLEPVYAYLQAHGGQVKGEYVHVGGWPLQILPPTGSLVEEALACAVTVDVDGVPARVFTAEHLAAVALQTGRAKDKARLLQFVEAGVLDAERFRAILVRHNLFAAWARFERQFLSDAL